jgi:hypothetical protein
MTSVLETDSNFGRSVLMIRRFFSKADDVCKQSRPGICPPIIVDERGTATVFESVDYAERYLEPIDVKNGEYIAYDSEGRLLRLIPTSPRITIESAEPEPHHSSEVRSLLIRLLVYTGVPPEILQSEDLQNLVARALEYKTR